MPTTPRSDLTRLVKATAIRLFVDGETATIAAFNRACGYGSATGHTPVNTHFNTLVAVGRLEMQATGNGNGKGPRAFNWTGRPTAECTFRPAAEAYLADPDVEEWRRGRFRRAVRHVTGAPKKCSEADLLILCERIAAKDIHGLPERAAKAAKLSGRSDQDGYNDAHHLRTAIRYGAERDMIPLVFPSFWKDDPWETAMLRWFPRNEDAGEDHKITAGMRNNLRFGCRIYREALTAFRPDDAENFADPADATAEIAREIREYLVGKGQGDRWTAVSGVFAKLGSVYHRGPYSAGKPHRPAFRLAPAPRRDPRTLEGFLAAVRAAGLPSDWEAAWRWLEQFETADRTRLAELGLARRTRRIKPQSFSKRLDAARAIIGVALASGFDRTTLTVQKVYGEEFEFLINRLQQTWSDTGERSGGLKDLVVHAGRTSEALSRWARARAGAKLSSGEGAKRQDQQRLLDKDRAAASGIAGVYLENAEWANGQASAILEEMEKASTSNNPNTKKNIQEVLEDTPPQYWLSIGEAFVAKLQKLAVRGIPATLDFHRLVLAAVIHCAILSAALRRSELAMLRIGAWAMERCGVKAHYDREGQNGLLERVFRLFAWDRKNQRYHEQSFREEFYPRWLEDLYLDHTRPFCIARGLEAGLLVERPKAAPGKPAPVGEQDEETGLPYSDDNFYLVDRFGVPYGCPEEGANGTNRDWRRLDLRKQSLADVWERQATKIAAEIGLTVPTRGWGFTLHDMRGVMGALIAELYDIPTAARFLGDDDKTVKKFYSFLHGKHIDLSGINSDAWKVRRPADRTVHEDEPADLPTAGRDVATYHAAVQSLMQTAVRAKWSMEKLDRELAELAGNYGLASAA